MPANGTETPHLAILCYILVMEARPYLTMQEIVRRWNVNITTVRRALNSRRNPLVGYKSPETERGIWLINTDSVIRRWGRPIY